MVIFDLICDAHHEFEGWFRNSDEFAVQQSAGMLTCPVCESDVVQKKLAAPKLGKKSNSTSAQQLALDPKGLAGAGSKEAYAQLQKMLGKVHDFIDANFEDVGNKFAEEALSMHKGEKDVASIKGTASADQLEELAEEGVSALALPPKPLEKKKLN